MKLDYVLEAENFDKYFLSCMSKLSTLNRENLPADLATKVFKKSGLSTKKVTFFQKVYMLQRALKKKVFIVIEDYETGIGIEDFLKFKKEFKKREATIKQSEELISKGAMVLGNSELVDHLYHLNKVCASTSYKFATKVKNAKYSAFFNYKKESLFFANLLIKYETSKRRIAKSKGLILPQMYVLLYMYDGLEKSASGAYNGIFGDTFNAGKSQLMAAFKKLTEQGYLTAFGKLQSRTYQITASGKDLINEIIFKYIAV